ncbi:MAG: TonB-dependent receptor, partial [Pseudomonadota bacterium]
LNYPLNSLDADLVAGVSYSFTDARFNGIQNFPSTELEPLGLLNARIGLDAENWSLSLYGKNLTNELEFVSVLYNEGNGATIFATPSGGFDIAITDAAVNTPRTIGVQLTLRH